MSKNINGYRQSHQGEDYGKNYQQHYSKDNNNTRVWDLEKTVLVYIIDKYFKNNKIKQYLDFACGTGRVCSFLENKVEESIGVDVSESMMKIARQRCNKTNFIIGDITKDHILEDKKFDLITAFRFFLNAEDGLRREALKSMRLLLKENGYLVFNIHGNKNSFRHFQIMLSGRGNEISPDEIRSLLNGCGFSVKEIIEVSFLHEIFDFIPRKIWFYIESIIKKIPFMKEKSIDFIVVAQINEKA